MIWYIYILLFIITGSWLLYLVDRKWRNLPPGPIGFPIFGTLLHVTARNLLNKHERFFLNLTRYRDEYGPVVSYRMGSLAVIVLNDFHDVKECLAKSVFAGRPNSAFYSMMTSGNKGLVMSEGDLWTDQRRFALRILKDFGFGKSDSEHKIREESRQLVEEIRSTVGTPVNTAVLFPKAVTNIICSLVFGKRFEYSDEALEQQIARIRAVTQVGGIGAFLGLFFPFLLPVCKYLPSSRKLINSMHSVHEYINQYVEEHKKRFDPCNEPVDFIDAFLLEKHNLTGEVEHHFTDTQLCMSVSDLFAAGSDTTSNALAWMMVCLSIHPDWQKKLRAEIQAECGLERIPKIADKKNLPLLQAFVDEVQRFNTIVSHSVDRRVMEDYQLRGFTIPSDHVVIINVHGIHRDPSLWSEPDTFDPNRFLDEQGKYKSSEYLIPYSVGKRSCLGEQLARMEIVIFLSAIVQNFEIELASASFDDLEDVLIGSEGLIHAPGEHKIIFKNIQ